MAKHKSLKTRIIEDVKAGKLKSKSLIASLRQLEELGASDSELHTLCDLALDNDWVRGKSRHEIFTLIDRLERGKFNPPDLPERELTPEEEQEARQRRETIMRDILKPKEPAPAPVPQTAKPKIDPDKPRNEYLDHLCPLPSAPAYLDEFSECKFKRLLREGHRTFQYILPDGRTVDENMHDCQKTKTDDFIPKIKVCKQPEWRMVLRIEDGELKWFSKKDAPKPTIEAFGGAKFCNFIPELFGIDTWR